MQPTKLIVANNLVELRKSRNLTQQQLADKFAYSDKSISKWEHGETLPDIETLKLLCDFYGVTLDYLVSERTPEEKQKDFRAEDPVVKTNKLIILGLALSVIWILATVIFVSLFAISHMLHSDKEIIYWMTFVWAVPLSILLLMVFNRRWKMIKNTAWLSIPFIWTLLGSIYLQAGISIRDSAGWSLWMLFIIGIPLTIAIVLLGTLRKKKSK